MTTNPMEYMLVFKTATGGTDMVYGSTVNNLKSTMQNRAQLGECSLFGSPYEVEDVNGSRTSWVHGEGSLIEDYDTVQEFLDDASVR